jgi:hypothetical protein
MTGTESDREIMNWAAHHVKGLIERALMVRLDGGSPEQAIDAARDGLRRMVQRVHAQDVREVGVVQSGPRKWWHWVYRGRERQDRVYLLAWPARMELQLKGYTDIDCFTNEGMN